MENETLKRNIPQLILILFAAALAVAAILLALNTIGLRRQAESLKAELEGYEKLISVKDEKIELLLGSESKLMRELQDAKSEAENLSRETAELQEQYRELDYRYGIITPGEGEATIDGVIVNENVPREVVDLFKTLITAVSGRDEELFFSIISNKVPESFAHFTADEYRDMMAQKFSSFNSAWKTLIRITPMSFYKPEEIENGVAFYSYVYAADSTGEPEGLGYEIGIERDTTTGQWKIFDFH